MDVIPQIIIFVCLLVAWRIALWRIDVYDKNKRREKCREKCMRALREAQACASRVIKPFGDSR